MRYPNDDIQNDDYFWMNKIGYIPLVPLLYPHQSFLNTECSLDKNKTKNMKNIYKDDRPK